MKELQSASVAAPGFFGLNTQESGALLSDGFALRASNCVIDKYGRLGARKGWTMRTTSGSTALSGNPIRSIFEYLNSDGSLDYISAGNNKIFRNGIGSSLVDMTPTMTITASNWQMASLANHCLMVQQGHEPVLFTRETGSPVCAKLVSHTGHGGFTSPIFGTGVTNGPNCVLAAYGRFWVARSDNNKTTLYWSTDIADASFPTFDTGAASTAGSMNLNAKLPNNSDEITGLAAHNGYIIVFLRNNIIVLRGNDDNFSNPTTMYVDDVIPGVGCVARDSIQKVGNDILFLTQSGVRSLGRTVQEKSMPMTDISKNVRDDLYAYFANSNVNEIRSCFSQKNAFYLLSFPSTNTNVVYCFDMRAPLENGAARVTSWDSYQAYAFSSNRDGSIYIGKPNGIAEYYGYTDNGSSYPFIYYTTYFDFQQPTTNKIVKKVGIVMIGGGGQQIVLKLGFDYQDSYDSFPASLSTRTPAEYNIAEYNIGEYSSGVFVDTLNTPLGGQGKVVQMGFEATVSGAPLSIQKMDIFTKLGRSY
jgi:hypothetical protein